MKLDKHTLQKIKPWIFLAVICTILAYVLMHISDIISFFKTVIDLSISLFYAIGIAYVLNLPMCFFERQFKKFISPRSWFYKRIRGISIFLTIICALLLIGILISIIVPQLIASTVMLSNNLVSYIGNIIKTINELLQTINLQETMIHFDQATVNQYIQSITANWEQYLQTATNWFGNAGQMIVKNAVAITIALGNWFMAFMLSMYLLSSKEQLITEVRKVIAAIFPVKVSRKIFEIGSQANEIFSSFLSGKLVEACILGMLIYIGMRLFGLGENFEILISVVVAVLSFIPMFGAIVAMFFGFFLILAINPIEALLFIIFYQTVQQLENSLIYPHVVGKSVGLPAIWVLLSIIVFGGLFGLLGMILSVPTTALLYSLLRDFIRFRLKKRNIKVTVTTFEVPEEEIIND